MRLSRSTSAHGNHNLEAVAVLHHDFAVRTLRNDLAVLLDRDFFARHRQLFEQLVDVDGMLESMRRTVDRDLDHGANSTARINALASPKTRFAGVVQWQNGSFPSCIRGFDSLHPLQLRPTGRNYSAARVVLQADLLGLAWERLLFPRPKTTCPRDRPACHQ